MSSVYCLCGKEAILRTSRSDRNPGRLYHSCPFKASPICKNFIGWAEPKADEEAQYTIPGLLRTNSELMDSNHELHARNKKLEEHLKDSRAESKKWKKYMILSWLMLFTVVFLKNS